MQTNRRIVVTGGTAGMGLECAVQLTQAGADVVITGRDPGRLAQAAADVAHRGGKAPQTFAGDFASLASVRALAAALLADGKPIHVLVNNAGTVFASRTVTVDGYEGTFAVNHLAPFLLTNLLLERIVASAPARIVNVASSSHYRGTMDLADPGYANGGWSMLAAYERSKLANVLFTRSLAARLAGRGVVTTALHPGTVATNIWTHGPWYARPLVPLVKRLMTTPATAGATLTRLAIAEEVADRTGVYFDRLTERAPSKLALDDALGEGLWAESARLVGL